MPASLTNNSGFSQAARVVLLQRGTADALAEARGRTRVTQRRALDEHYAVGAFSLQLLGWDRPRRLRGDPCTAARRAQPAGKKITGGSRLHLSRLR
jgi:hypothetical protein